MKVAAGSAVEVTVVGGNLRNDLKTQDTYVRVERSVGGTWMLVAEDGDPETRLRAVKQERIAAARLLLLFYRGVLCDMCSAVKQTLECGMRLRWGG